MFEQSYNVLEMQIATCYGRDGIVALKEFRNNETLDAINSMSDDDLETFYQIIEKNFFETEILLNGCIRNCYLPEEERFDYDSFYHICYQKISTLISKGNKRETKYEALKYKGIIDNIKDNIKSASDIKKYFKATYKVKDKTKLSSAKKIYQLKKYIETYFKKLIKEGGFDIEVKITLDDILMLVKAILNGLSDEEVLSKLSFVANQEDLLNYLKNFEEEFKEILVKLSFDENNNFIILTKNFVEEELEIYLYVIEGLEKTKSVKEEDMLNSVFGDESTKEPPFLQKRYSMEE